jgi:Protein of unknown function (DUF4065)
MEMQFDRNKLKAVVLTALNRCPSERVGAVKLHKILYFFDMLSFIQTGVGAVGATYRKRPFGPTCEPLLGALREMEREGQVVIGHSDYYGYRKTDYRPLVAPDSALLSKAQEDLLSDVIDFVCLEYSASTISEYSHQAPWEAVEFGDVIPYASAYFLLPMQVSPEAFERTEQGAAEVEKARSDANAVDFGTYRDFRARVLSKAGVADPRGT